MQHITGHNRHQTLLLPESLDEYVGPDNPVRFIEAFVDGLDLTAAGFIRVTPKLTGRPGYAPTDSSEALAAFKAIRARFSAGPDQARHGTAGLISLGYGAKLAFIGPALVAVGFGLNMILILGAPFGQKARHLATRGSATEKVGSRCEHQILAETKFMGQRGHSTMPCPCGLRRAWTLHRRPGG